MKVKDIGGEEVSVATYVDRLKYRQTHPTMREDLPPDPDANLVVCLAGHGLRCGQRVPLHRCEEKVEGKTQSWECGLGWKWHIKRGLLHEVRGFGNGLGGTKSVLFAGVVRRPRLSKKYAKTAF